MLQWEMNTPYDCLSTSLWTVESCKVCGGYVSRPGLQWEMDTSWMSAQAPHTFWVVGLVVICRETCDLQSDLYVSVSLPGMGMEITRSVWVAVTSARISRKIRTDRCSILSSVFRTTPDHFRPVLVADVGGLAMQNMTDEEPAWLLLRRYSWDSNHFFFSLIFSLKIKLKKKNGREKKRDGREKKKGVCIYIIRSLYAGASDKVPCAKFGFLLKSWCGLKLLNLWTCVPFSWFLSSSSVFFVGGGGGGGPFFFDPVCLKMSFFLFLFFFIRTGLVLCLLSLFNCCFCCCCCFQNLWQLICSWLDNVL